MKRQNKLLPCITLISLFILFAGCAVKTKIVAPPLQAPNMKYVMPTGQTLTYRMTSGFYQTMSVQGQSIKTSVMNDMTFSINQIAHTDDTYQLEVTVNKVAMKVSSSPGGDITPNLSKIPGKTFEMMINNLGEQIELTGADELTYTLGQAGERTLAREFEHFFPNLPGYPMNVGDTWSTVDTIDISDGGMETLLVINSENTLACYELINGHECAKIDVEYTCLVTSQGKQAGANFVTAVELAGKESWHFDYKQGLFIKFTSTGGGDGTVDVMGQQKMTLPVSQTVTLEVWLVE